MSLLRPRLANVIDGGGAPEVAAKTFFGVFGQDPVLNPINIFSDEAETIQIANPQDTNSVGLTINRVFASVDYSYQIDNMLGDTIEGPFDVRLSSRTGFDTADALSIITLTETSPNLYNIDEGFASLPPTGVYELIFPTTNTGNVDITFTGLAGTFELLDEDGNELSGGELVVNKPRSVFWDTVEWKLQPSGGLGFFDIQLLLG